MDRLGNVVTAVILVLNKKLFESRQNKIYPDGNALLRTGARSLCAYIIYAVIKEHILTYYNLIQV